MPLDPSLLSVKALSSFPELNTIEETSNMCEFMFSKYQYYQSHLIFETKKLNDDNRKFEIFLKSNVNGKHCHSLCRTRQSSLSKNIFYRLCHRFANALAQHYAMCFEVV